MRSTEKFIKSSKWLDKNNACSAPLGIIIHVFGFSGPVYMRFSKKSDFYQKSFCTSCVFADFFKTMDFHRKSRLFMQLVFWQIFVKSWISMKNWNLVWRLLFTIGAIKKNFAVHGRQFGLSLNISGHIVQALDEIGNGLQKRFIAFVKIKDGGFSTVERKLTYAYHRWRWFLRLQR